MASRGLMPRRQGRIGRGSGQIFQLSGIGVWGNFILSNWQRRHVSPLNQSISYCRSLFYYYH